MSFAVLGQELRFIQSQLRTQNVDNKSFKIEAKMEILTSAIFFMKPGQIGVDHEIRSSEILLPTNIIFVFLTVFFFFQCWQCDNHHC